MKTLRPLPSGTVTFAFTDIEGSTLRWERDRTAMTTALRLHDVLVRSAIERCGGYVFKAIGDAFCAVFRRPQDAVSAMLDVQRTLVTHDFSAIDGLPVRAAVHTGTAEERDGDYFGPAVNRVARLLALAHGGQVLCSGATAAVVRTELPPHASLRDLGEHTLKDLDANERIYQLVAPGVRDDFPPLRSSGPITHLPVTLTSFVGRESELEEIAVLVRANRLVTLTGSGGVGKTRTSLRVAATVADDFDDGVWFIDLAPLSSGEHIASTAAHALGIALPHGGDPLQHFLRTLKVKQMLLVMDNCEHLAAEVARFLIALLSTCANVKVLATSRQPLEVPGEQTYRLPPLDLTAATELFVERARTVDEGFTLSGDDKATVAEICRRLDGIPLAIELAASRAAVLSPKQIAAKLDERFRLLAQKGGERLPRQQTLRALIDWSFDLLDDDERAVFARLSAFAGGWTLEAASAVCADDTVDEWRLLDLLTALVSKSLVVTERSGDDRRYRMLNSIRDYSRERLAANGNAEAIAGKHAAYFARLVAEHEDLAAQLEDEKWQHALVAEIDNIRAALQWSIVDVRGSGAGFHLLAHLEWPELVTTPNEAVSWYDAASAIGEVEIDAATQARLLCHYVRLEWLVGRSTAQRERRAADAVRIARESGDRDALAHALTLLGSVYRDAQRFDEAERLFTEAHEHVDAISPIARNALLRNWAVSNLQRGEVELARQRFTEVARRERPGSEAHASALLNIGELEFAIGNVETARAAARQARATFARLKTAPLALADCNLGAYAMALDELDEARESLNEALDVIQRTGARWTLTALEHHALLAGLRGDHERAALLAGFTSAQYAGDDTRQTTERIGYERLMRLLRKTFDEPELADLMDAGARLNDEQALEHAATITVSKRTAAAAQAAEKRE